MASEMRQRLIIFNQSRQIPNSMRLRIEIQQASSDLFNDCIVHVVGCVSSIINKFIFLIFGVQTPSIQSGKEEK